MSLPKEIQSAVKRTNKQRNVVLRPEILLCPNVPKPMHGVAPRVVLGGVWWDATRQAAYKSTGYRCLACGVYKFDALCKQWMEGHELYEIDYQKGRMVYVETVPLCHYCHNYIHDGRLNALLDKREMTQAKFLAVMQHGDSVLAAAGLKRGSRRERDDEIVDLMLTNQMAQWKDWRMVCDGKKYKPKFKNPAQWKKVYG